MPVLELPDRLRLLAAPVASGAVAFAGLALLHVRDPHRSGSYGFCPFHAFTGLWCPGCGGLRALGDVSHGELGAALADNVLVAPLVLVLVVAGVWWTLRRWRGENVRMIVLNKLATGAIVVALVLFTIARNTPGGAWLAPG